MTPEFWTTKQECLWIDHIGRDHHSTAKAPRRNLLVRLKEAYRNRKDWSGIDRAKVENHLDAAIRECGA